MPIKPQQQEPQKDLPIVRIFRFMGWFFVIFLIADLAAIAANIIAHPELRPEECTNFYTLTLSMLTALYAGLFFGTAGQIRENPERKNTLIKSLFIAAVMFNIIFILAMAAYRW